MDSKKLASRMLVPVLLLVGLTFLGFGIAAQEEGPTDLAAAPQSTAPPAPTTPAAPEQAVPEEGGAAPQGSVFLAASTPVEVEIPSIGVRSALIRLGQNDDGSLAVPQDYDLAGWYERSPTPGEQGPAVIAGHVDSHSGPAVFYRLTELEPGAEVLVRREDGTVARFRVDRVEQYPKEQFPTVEVYRNLDHAGLRLITCGGEFDEETNHYRDNIVAYAALVT